MFRLRGVLVGTIAYQTYAAMLGVRLRGALTQTSDVDVAQFLSVSIAVQDQTDSMEKVLQEIDPTFRKIPNLDRNAPTRYISSWRLRVDFLVPHQGADSDEPLYLPALKTAAEPLRFPDFLIYEPVKAVLLHGGGTAVTVPSPGRFAVHNLILSRRRKSSEAKAELFCPMMLELSDLAGKFRSWRSMPSAARPSYGLLDLEVTMASLGGLCARGPPWL